MTLPQPAAERVARIEALLAQADAALAQGGASDEAAFSLRETRARYLPDTLRAYFDVPAGLRAERDATGATPDERLIAQLDHLERAAGARLRELGARGTNALAANGAFLAERFGAAETLPAAPSAGAVTAVDVAGSLAAAPPMTPLFLLMRSLTQETQGRPLALMTLLAERLGTLLPQFVSVKRGLFGMGAIEAVSIDAPVDATVTRYTLAAGRAGVEASFSKIVRGVALKTQRTEIDVWLAGLYADLGAFYERDRAARETLTRFLEH